MEATVKSLPEAVYKAEAESLDRVARKFPTFSEVEGFVEEVLESEWWQNTFPTAPIRVIVEKRSSSARFALATSGGVIAIPNSPSGRTTSTVLHELAHTATDRVDGHGPIYRSAMLKLVRHYMGFYAYVNLEHSYSNWIK